MYAIIKTGGKQYTVKSGDVIQVEKLTGNPGDKIVLSDVLMVGGNSPTVGKPFVKDAEVAAQIVEQFRDDKVIIFKKKRRHNYRRKKGHRQYLTALQITSIALGGKILSEAQAKAKPVKTAAAPKPAKQETEAKAAPKKEAAAPKKETKTAEKPKAAARPKAEKTESKAAKPAAKKPAASKTKK